MTTQRFQTSLAAALIFLIYLAGCASLFAERQGAASEVVQAESTLQAGSADKVKTVYGELSRATLLDSAQSSVATPAHSTDVLPPEWLKNRAWRPKRHVGPFYQGSDFALVQIVANGSGGAWYFNDFFATSADEPFYAPYFNNSLPSTSTPSNTPVPGTVPTGVGFNSVVFGLERISYTSRYGGSVELSFSMTEDLAYELRGSVVDSRTTPPTTRSFVWDLSSMRMNVYVQPYPPYFNHPNQVANVKIPIIEFVPEEFIAYEVVATASGGAAVQVLPQSDEDAMDALQQTLASRAQTMAGAWRHTAARFVHGFLHGQFQNEIGPLENVTAVEVADDHFQVFTSTGTAQFTVEMRLHPISVRSSQGLDNVTGDVAGHFVIQPPVGDPGNPITVREFAVAGGDSTVFQGYGTTDVADCGSSTGVIASVTADGWGVRKVVFINHRSSDAVFGSFTVPCQIMRDLLSQHPVPWGVVSGPSSVMTETLSDEDGVFGSFTLVSRVRMTLH